MEASLFLLKNNVRASIKCWRSNFKYMPMADKWRVSCTVKIFFFQKVCRIQNYIRLFDESQTYLGLLLLIFGFRLKPVEKKKVTLTSCSVVDVKIYFYVLQMRGDEKCSLFSFMFCSCRRYLKGYHCHRCHLLYDVPIISKCLLTCQMLHLT